MFNAASYKSMYQRFMGPLAQPVTLKVSNGAGFDEYPGVQAHVSRYQESDLVPGGPIELGDLRLVIENSEVPAGVARMARKDRIEIDGHDYGVIHWDPNTRSVGAETIAIQATVRG